MMVDMGIAWRSALPAGSQARVELARPAGAIHNAKGAVARFQSSVGANTSSALPGMRPPNR